MAAAVGGCSAFRSFRTELAPVLAAAGQARSWAADRLAECCPPDLADDAILLVSELVANAVRAHQERLRLRDRRNVELMLTMFSGTLRIEVYDRVGRDYPELARADCDAETGRGLQVVSAVAAQWGWRDIPGGKVVWCDLQVSGQPAGLSAGDYPHLVLSSDSTLAL
jgi:Histidine kinase-like ATPase domain